MDKIKYSKLCFRVDDYNKIATVDIVQRENILGNILSNSKNGTIEGMHTEFSNALGDILKTASKKQLDFNKSRSLYRFPNLTLSRDRVAILKDKYGIKVVRDKDKAHLWVISDKYLESLTKYRYGITLYPADRFFTELESRKSQFTDDVFVSLMGQKESLTNSEDTTESMHFIELENYFYGSNIIDDIKTKLDPYILEVHSGNYLTERSIQEYKDLKSNINILATDVVINTATAEDSVALNFENYTQIDKMLEGNKEDMNVAMTLMANCKIESSKTWLSILFYDHTYSMRGNKMWNQVAFKTLKKMFDKYMNTSTNNYYRDINDIKFLTSNLVKDGILNSEAEAMMLDRVYKSIMKYMNSHGETKILLDRKDIKLDVIKVAEKSSLVGDAAGALV